MTDQKRTLFIHIGVRKTGTSAIQDFLDLNRDRLYRDGYIFRLPKLYDYDRSTRIKNSKGEEVLVENFRIYPKLRNGIFLHGNPGDPHEENVRRLNKGLRIIKKWLNEKPNVILTDEHISRDWSRWDFLKRVKEFSAENDFDVRVIIFLRKQDVFLDSFYRQDVKDHFHTEKWDTFLSGNKHSDMIPTNYEKMLASFSAIFGKENLDVIPYEPGIWAKDGGSIFSVFMNAIGITDQQGYELPGGLSNESTTYNQTEIMRILNRLTEASDPLKVKTKKFFEKASIDCSGISKDKRKLSYFSDNERRDLMDEYKDENRRIAREYLNRDELFLSGDSSAEKWEYDLLAMQEEMILYFGYVTKQLHEEIQSLRENSLSFYSIKLKLYRIKKKFLNHLDR